MDIAAKMMMAAWSTSSGRGRFRPFVFVKFLFITSFVVASFQSVPKKS